MLMHIYAHDHTYDPVIAPSSVCLCHGQGPSAPAFATALPPQEYSAKGSTSSWKEFKMLESSPFQGTLTVGDPTILLDYLEGFVPLPGTTTQSFLTHEQG